MYQNEGVPDVAYLTPVCACVWRGGVTLPGAGLAFKVCCCCLFVVCCCRPGGVGVFRGTFPGTGTTRMCSPHRDLQNVPENLGAKPPNIAKTKAIAPKSTHWETITWETFCSKLACV